MADKVVKDPRETLVIVHASTISHARKHSLDLGGEVEHHAVKTLEQPDKVVANPKSFRAKDKTSDERYVRYDPELDRFVIVPTKTTTEDEEVAGYGVVSAGSKLALTVFADTKEPVARVLWRSKKL